MTRLIRTTTSADWSSHCAILPLETQARRGTHSHEKELRTQFLAPLGLNLVCTWKKTRYVSLSHPLSPSLTHSLTPSLSHSLTHSLTPPLSPTLTHSLTHSPRLSLTHSLAHSHTHSLTHSPHLSLPHSPSLNPSLLRNSTTPVRTLSSTRSVRLAAIICQCSATGRS